jgi:hypothetical protein
MFLFFGILSISFVRWREVEIGKVLKVFSCFRGDDLDWKEIVEFGIARRIEFEVN